MALKEKQAYADIAYTKAKTAELSNPYTDSSNNSKNSSYNKLYKNLSSVDLKNNTTRRIMQNLVYGEVKNGHISEKEAEGLFNQFGL